MQDRRYWVIHLITIPSLFLAGVIFIFSGFVYKLFGVANFNQYFLHDNTQISLMNDRLRCLKPSSTLKLALVLETGHLSRIFPDAADIFPCNLLWNTYGPLNFSGHYLVIYFHR